MPKDPSPEHKRYKRIPPYNHSSPRLPCIHGANFPAFFDKLGMETCKRLCGVSESTIYRWLREEIAPPVSVLYACLSITEEAYESVEVARINQERMVKTTEMVLRRVIDDQQRTIDHLRGLDYGSANEPLYPAYWSIPINPEFWQPDPRAKGMRRKSAPAPVLTRYGFL